MGTRGTRALEDLASEQWGLLTAAQAADAGVARSTLTRREQSGALERIRHGVYKLATTPIDGRDELRAAWLASAPAISARERRLDPDAVVGGAASAWVHDMGDIKPAPFMFWTRDRKQTRAPDVRYRTATLPADDVTLVDGLPVTTRERTLSDLLDADGVDLSLVADALGDAERSLDDLDVRQLSAHLDPRARALGFDDGEALYLHLRSLSGIDGQRLRNLIVHTDLEQRVQQAIAKQVEDILAPLRTMAQQYASDETSRVAIRSVGTLPPIVMPKMKLPMVVMPKVRLPPIVIPRFELPPGTRAALEAAVRSAAAREAVEGLREHDTESADDEGNEDTPR
jgi:hypothetical protein